MNQHVSPPGPTVIRNQEDAFVVLPSAQVDAINCMIEIIDEPYTGDGFADYNLRRNPDAQGDRVEVVSQGF